MSQTDSKQVELADKARSTWKIYKQNGGTENQQAWWRASQELEDYIMQKINAEWLPSPEDF